MEDRIFERPKTPQRKRPQRKGGKRSVSRKRRNTNSQIGGLDTITFIFIILIILGIFFSLQDHDWKAPRMFRLSQIELTGTFS